MTAIKGKMEAGAISITFTTFGVEEIALAYRLLSNASKKSLIINSATKVLRPLAKTAKTNLKSRHKFKTKNLYKSIQVARFDTDTVKGAYVKARRVKNKYKGYHSHLLDLGTKERVTKSGRRTGKVKPTKWWKDAVDSHYKGIDPAFEKEINEGLIRMIKKYNARTLK